MAREIHDVVIAGGGPAGLATAIACRLGGLEVVVVDAGRPGADRPCGEGIMPGGWQVLVDLGVEVAEADRASFRGIRYVDGELEAEGRFPGRPGYGVRRKRLHGALCSRAEELGVELRWGTRVRGVSGASAGGSGSLELVGDRVTGRWLVAADGRLSLLRAAAGLEARAPRRRRFGVRRHYRLEPWTDLVEVHWAERAEAYVTPVGRDEVGVALLWSGGSSRFDDLLERFPQLAGRLEGMPAITADRGAGPFGLRARRPVEGRMALVGDASACLDPITGEGLTLAFHEAVALAGSLITGDLGMYRSAHRRILRLPRLLTGMVMLLERSPGLRRRVLRLLRARPRLFDAFLELAGRGDAAGPGRRLGLVGLALAAVGSGR